MFLINGQNKTHIDVIDRGFQYGDGLFETIEIFNRKPVFLDFHLKRLATGCDRLLIPCPAAPILAAEANQLSRQAPEQGRAVLKIIITRGCGGRGYQQPENISPTRVLSLHPFPEYPVHFWSEGVNARLCKTRLAINPLLAGLKHLNRLEQVLARAEWKDSSIQEGIMLNTQDIVVEGTMSNLFYIKNSIIHTSGLQQCGIAGIMRDIIIKLINLNGFSLLEHDFSSQALFAADEVFICNSLIGIWPVKQIDGQRYAIGSITKKIQGLLNRYHADALQAD